MRLRTFSAANMSEAIRLVRDELGPDAVILNTETIGKTVKITAALDRAAILEPTPLPAKEPLDSIAAMLDFHRIPSLLSDRLLSIAEHFMLENPRQALGAALRARFSFEAILTNRPERPLMLVGLPGAGKTATLAKLAVAAKAANRPVVAVTCDLAKAGGVDQLAIYAKAMDIPAYQAKNLPALTRAVDAAPEGALILIDTAGVNPLRPDDLSGLAELAGAVKAEPVLVLASGGDVAESAEQGQLFAEIGCQRLIATRIDAARRYGGLLAAAEGGKLALAEFGISPEISTGLAFFGADALARLLMPPDSAGKSTRPSSGRPTERVAANVKLSGAMAGGRKGAQNGAEVRTESVNAGPPAPGRDTVRARKRSVESKT